MQRKAWLASLALLLLISSLAFSQSRETGAIIGTVQDQEGIPLPGATVTLSSPNLMGTRTFVTAANGFYRFPALPPGDYTVKAELQGFKTVIRANIRLTTTVRLTADITLEQSAVAEEVTVIAHSPTVDIKSTETASVTLSEEILRNIPYSQFTADIIKLAPGVNDNHAAFGASADTGIASTMDGVNVADPEAGSAWVFLDHNIIEEAKVMGVGLPAEYGNFTGVIFNLVTKSGGNNFSGHFEADFQGKKGDWPKGFWQTENTDAYLEDFPELTSPLSKLLDVSGHLGGPIKRDRLWFYVGLQWYNSKDYATGFPEAIDYVQPRSFWKLTSQTSPNTNMTVSVEIDTYNGKNRAPLFSDYAQLSPETTLTQKSPEAFTNFSLTHIIDPKSFFDVKVAFIWGYYHLDPEMGKDIPAHFSLDQNKWLYNAYHYGYYDRARFQVNASYTHFAEDFIQGDHDFKFGVEVERSYVRNRFGYGGDGLNDPLFGDTGLANTYFIDYQDQPYLAYQYEGYDLNSSSTRIEAFAQDSWQVTKRLNLNAGVRLSQNWGWVKDVEGAVYKTFRIAPRLGFTFDLFGDKTTVIKAHYGQFTEAMLSRYFDRLNPDSAFKDFIKYYWDADTEEWVEFTRTAHESLYEVADGIKHPYMNQFVVGIERELFKDASVSLSYIRRDWKNIIGYYDLLADYERVNVYVPDLDQTFEIYERTIHSVDTHQFVLDNIKKDPQKWILGDPHRSYWGLEFLFNKRFSNRWQLLLSYVYSQAKGTMDNGFANDIGYGERDDLFTGDPNFWINAEGNSTNDPTHMLKIQGTYVLPLDISFSAYFRAVTGNAWTTRFKTSLLNQGLVTFFAEPRGAHHYDIQKVLDLRLEKTLTLSGRYRLGVFIDVFNVFNDDTITDWGTQIGDDWNPGDTESTDGHELYGLVAPRQARVGLRLTF